MCVLCEHPHGASQVLVAFAVTLKRVHVPTSDAALSLAATVCKASFWFPCYTYQMRQRLVWLDQTERWVALFIET